MAERVRQVVAPVVLGATVILFTAFSGCEKGSKPTTPIDRTEDPAYTEMLKKSRSEQVEIAKGRQSIARNMERMRQRARDVLGKDATEAQVAAELDAHPEKYPGWRELKARAQESEQKMKAVNEKTRAAIRARILKEAADRRAAQKNK